jgi:hypothetical protein
MLSNYCNYFKCFPVEHYSLCVRKLYFHFFKIFRLCGNCVHKPLLTNMLVHVASEKARSLGENVKTFHRHTKLSDRYRVLFMRTHIVSLLSCMFIHKRGNGFLSQCIHERAFTRKHTLTLGHKRAHMCAYTDEQNSRSRFGPLRHRRTRKSTVLMAGLISMSSINTTHKWGP